MTAFSRTVGVIGTGIMGQGITQSLLEKGVTTILCGRRKEIFPEIEDSLRRTLKMSVRRKRADEETVNSALDVFSMSDNYADLAECDIIIEAVAEDFHVKVEVLGSLVDIIKESAAVTTNTSCLSVKRLAEASGLGSRLVGLHFMNPVPASHLAELIRYEGAGEEQLLAAGELAEYLSLTVVTVEDAPGFVVNRLLMPVIAEAARALDGGVAEAREIDTAMRLGCGWAMGPLSLADMIGLDIVLAELQQLEHELGARYAPPENLLQLVDDGHLGRKTGQGFMKYK